MPYDPSNKASCSNHFGTRVNYESGAMRSIAECLFCSVVGSMEIKVMSDQLHVLKMLDAFK
jgi:hypothetical protein